MYEVRPFNVQYNENKFISVSDIVSYYLCPRLAYFRNGHDEGLTDREVRAGVYRSVSCGLGAAVSSAHPDVAVKRIIADACSDALCIYGPVHEDAIAKAGNELASRAVEIISGLYHEKERQGEPQLMRILSPSAVGIAVYSDKLRISGLMDKVVMRDNCLMPMVISASFPPGNGVYASDRIKLAAYAMLLSEKYAVDCSSGCIEYVSGWCIRTAEVRYEDKRKVLYARNRINEIKTGKMPEASRGKWCGRCSYADACNVRVSMLDSLFKK
jgi:CRISPR-associated exonuclease Cas4